MKSKFDNKYWKSAVTKVQTLEKMDAWDVVDRPQEKNVLDGTWTFKLKRYPDGLIKKFKARFCARGEHQFKGVDFFETYVPVLQCTAVWLVLILEVLLDLKSKRAI